jgi:hypothetical protein
MVDVGSTPSDLPTQPQNIEVVGSSEYKGSGRFSMPLRSFLLFPGPAARAESAFQF